MIRCDRCGGNTKEKVITSKKPETRGNQYTVLECLGGCRSGKYAYTFFPPREGDGKSKPVEHPKTNGAGNEAVTLLRSIDTTLKNILSIMQQKSGVIAMQPNEMQPDEEAPF